MSGQSQSPDSPRRSPASPSSGPRRWVRLPPHRWARRAIWGAAGVLGLWAVGWLAVPPLLKWQGEKIASEQLGRAVRIGAVEFKPWTLELTLSDVSIAGLGEAPPLFSARRLYADAALQSVFRLAPVIDAVQVDAPVLRLAHQGGGHYDVDDILARLAARPQPKDEGEPARFALYNIDLRDGRVEFDDQAVGRRHEVADLHLSLPFISNLPSAREVRVQPQLAFAANGSRFDSRAQALPFADSRHTDATLRLSGLDLKPYLGYLPAGLPVRLQAAMVDADLRLGFEQTPQPSLRIDGTLAVTGLQSVDAQGADALAFDALKLHLAEARPLERKLHLASLELTGPRIAVRRGKDGQINLLPPPDATEKIADGEDSERAGGRSDGKSAAPAASRASAAASGAPAAPAFALAIDKLAVHGGTLDFTDESTAGADAPAAVVRLNALELAAASVAYPLTQPMSFSGSAALAGTEGLTPPLPETAPAPARRARRAAPVAVASAAAPAPGAGAPTLEFQGSASARQAEVNARVAGVPLALAGPYLSPYLVPRLTGALDAHVGLQWAPPKARDLPPELKVAAERLVLSRLMLAGDGAAPAGPGRAAAPRRGEPLASIERVELADVLVDLRTRAVTVGQLGVRAPRLAVERGADQRWMAEHWLRQPAAAATAAPPKPAAGKSAPGGPQADFPWKVVVNDLALSGGTIGWRDSTPAKPVQAELTQVQVQAQKIDLAGRQPMPVSLSARIGPGGRARGEPGRLSWRGSVGLEPLAAQGAVEAERLPVHVFEPYFGEALNADILRADASFKGQLAFTQPAQGPRARLAGDARVEELRTHSRPGTAASAGDATAPVAAARAPAASRAPLAPGGAGVRASLGEELLSWKQLRLAGLDVRLEPGQAPQVEVKDTLLSDFYARLVIHPNGRINLQDVVKSEEGAAAGAPPPAAAGAPPGGQPAAGEGNADAAVSGAAGASGTPAAARKADPMAPVFRFGPTRLASGRIDFSDRFIRPNYSANLSELNGTLGAFASVAPGGAPQMAELKLTGRAEGSAALDVAGRLNPLADPLALDIQAKVTDLELPPLSPYSVKYAGHGIERGKLSMDVGYKVEPDGRLTATNRLVLNQLEFGEPVAGAPASLPVRLATALLADSRGVIDLDLPISGSLNDPQFSIGPIIVKAIINLIGKAITAPFTLLARALGGGGDDMAHVAFEPGSARLGDKAREQLDKVAKALADRPQLKLTVAGTARLAPEREGYRRERLRALVAAEKRGAAPAAVASAPDAVGDTNAPVSGATGAASALAGSVFEAETPVVAVTDAEYPELLKRLYRRADIPGKPRNAIGFPRDLPVAEMESLLMAHIDVDEDAMRRLAVQRGVAVKDYLAGKNLPAERLFLGAARTGAAAASTDAASAPASTASAAGRAWSPGAELNLTAR